MLHVHVFLVAPLGTRHMAKSRADQHQGSVPVRQRPHHAGSAADLTIQPLDHIVSADACPVLAGEVVVGQRLRNAVFRHSGWLLSASSLSALQRAVPPVLEVDVGFLVHLTDGSGRDLTALHSASVMFSTWRTETPVRYISMGASSTLL